MSNKSEQHYQNIKPKPSESFSEYMLRKQLISMHAEQQQLKKEIENLEIEKKAQQDFQKIICTLILAFFGGITLIVQMFSNVSKYPTPARVGFVLLTAIWLFGICLVQLGKSKNAQMLTLILVGAYAVILIGVVVYFML